MAHASATPPANVDATIPTRTVGRRVDAERLLRAGLTALFAAFLWVFLLDPMARIALATGTAFAVLALARTSSDGLGPATLGALGAFMGGAVSSSVAAWFGRRARDLAATARNDWKRALNAAERELSGEPGEERKPRP